MTSPPVTVIRPHPAPWKAALVLLLGAAIVLLMPWHPRQVEGWVPLLWDWGHAPLFTGLAWLLVRTFRHRGLRLSQAALWTLAIAGGLAGGSELMQHWTGRSGQWPDFFTDLSGTTAGLCLAAAGDFMRKHRIRGLGLAVIGAAVFLGSAWPLLEKARLHVRNSLSFPLLEDFETRSSLTLWRLEYNGQITPLILGKAPDSSQGLIVSIPSSGLTSLHYDTQGRDWASFHRLVFDYELKADEAVTLGVRLDGVANNAPPIRLEAALQPGRHTAAISLPSSVPSFPHRARSSFRKLVLFFMEPKVEAALCLDRLRLEP